ncbi:MAG: extracellular solute-binding protein [bacterium]
MWIKNKKTVLILLSFITACGCGGHSKRDMERELIYWSANNQDEIDLAKEVVGEWNRSHPEAPVRHQPVPEGQSSEEVILAAVVGKSPPDVYSNMWPGDVQLYVNAKALVPLSQFADFDSVMSSRVKEEILEEARSQDGQVYQIPWKTNPIMMIYNKKMLAENGFPNPPRTYSEFEEQAKVITADLDGDGYTDRYMALMDIRVTWYQRFFDYYSFYIAASGGQTLLKNGKVYFDNPISVTVFDFIQGMYKKGYFPLEKYQGRVDPFLSERVAIRFTGPWEIKHAEKFKPKGFEYDFAPVPVPDTLTGPVYTYGDFKNIVMFKTNKNPETVWSFVKFMISRENDTRLLKMTNQLPVRKNILSDPLFRAYFEKNPKMMTFAKQAEHVRGTDLSKDLKEIFNAISQEYEACVVYGAKPPEEAVADAAKRAELILRK